MALEYPSEREQEFYETIVQPKLRKFIEDKGYLTLALHSNWPEWLTEFMIQNTTELREFFRGDQSIDEFLKEIL